MNFELGIRNADRMFQLFAGYACFTPNNHILTLSSLLRDGKVCTNSRNSLGIDYCLVDTGPGIVLLNKGLVVAIFNHLDILKEHDLNGLVWNGYEKIFNYYGIEDAAWKRNRWYENKYSKEIAEVHAAAYEELKQKGIL